MLVEVVGGVGGFDDDGADAHSSAACRPAHPSPPGVHVDVQLRDAPAHLSESAQRGHLTDHTGDGRTSTDTAQPVTS